MKIPPKLRKAASMSPSKRVVAGPGVQNPRERPPPQVSRLPDILLDYGETLVQARLPPRDVSSLRKNTPDIMQPERTPPPDSSKHRRKRAEQWTRWQTATIPLVLPHLATVLHVTKSLREVDDLQLPPPQPDTCRCAEIKTHRVAIVRFSKIEDVQVQACQCTPLSLRLVQGGVFGCAPIAPSLAVDMRVLEFARNLFLHIALNNTAFCKSFLLLAESILTKVAELLALSIWKYTIVVHASVLPQPAPAPAPEPAPTPAPAPVPAPPNPQQAQRPPTPIPSLHPHRLPCQPMNLRQTLLPHRRAAAQAKGPPTTGRRRAHQRPRLAHGSVGGNRLQNPDRCPSPSLHPELVPANTYGNVAQGVLETSSITQTNTDLMVCIDACFTQKKKKSQRDPPKFHHNTHFVPESVARQTEEYVEGVRQQQKKNTKRPKTTGCSYLAPTDFFEDTAVMALLCRHDRVLWVVNMHSAGEKQFNVVALMETLFQHLPHNIRVGLLYDVGCTFERSCRKWGFLSRFLDRLAFAVSVFHAFGHEWACQLLYHPCRRVGFGFTNGEGCKRFWHSISYLIAHLRICGYHNRLYTLDAQIEHADEASLLRLGGWVLRRHKHSRGKRVEATKALAECGYPIATLRTQWLLQVTAQTKPLPKRSKNSGQQAVKNIILLRGSLKTRQQQLAEARVAFVDAAEAV
ncbi:hypothetical protein B0H16DRAFT_1752431 [Mycena metata]|uniref:CxC1-like cysteine cluster associated with KDZ transposases domain-containing protein n=1 Tax=Mycena metata TaxID=1033252 RepID=A0AAD7DI57_9AGAR|nr:hypothetical protein B0H16DRAFT_1752431 [Mycena metata]